MMKLRINPIVAEDLKNIKEYIAEDNEEMAVKTIQEIYARIECIWRILTAGFAEQNGRNAKLNGRITFDY